MLSLRRCASPWARLEERESSRIEDWDIEGTNALERKRRRMLYVCLSRAGMVRLGTLGLEGRAIDPLDQSGRVMGITEELDTDDVLFW